MSLSHTRIPHHQISRELAAVAMGRKPADLIVKNGRLVDVCTARIHNDMDIAVYQGHIALVGDASHVQAGPDTEVVDVSGRYLCPGLIDSHMHVESSMVDLPAFAAGVLPQGTTTICPDIHELTNVLGMGAVDLFHQCAARLPLKVLTAMPVCVPALPGMEDAGAVVTPALVQQAYESGRVFLQGEQMNFPGVIFGDQTVHQTIAAGIRANKVLTGHYASTDLNAGLNAYIAAGMTADHETTTAQGAKARAMRGMYVQLRYGSAWLDLPQLAEAVTHDPGVDTRLYTLVTDDVSAATIVTEGHLVRVAEDNALCRSIPRFTYPEWALNTVHLNLLDAADFQISAPHERPVQVRVIQMVPDRVHTVSKTATLEPRNHALHADPEQDLAKAAVFYRHSPGGGADRSRGLGFVNGTGFVAGTAYASTVCHDCHNLLAVGMDDAAMALAANTLIKSGGGLAVVKDKRVLAHLPLPLGGIMGISSMKAAAEGIENIEKALAQIGCPYRSFEMTLSLLGLAVLGELRLSNRGLVALLEGQAPRFVNLILES